MSKAKSIVLTSLFTALVFIATVILTLYIPSTHGYFNLGETMVYTTALTLGPIVGAVAGGLGSALADIALGYTIYAPGTLIIKGAEGYIVGLLSIRLRRAGREAWRKLMISAGIVGGFTIATIGSTFYVGESTIGPGVQIPAVEGVPGIYIPAITIFLTSPIWIIIGLIFLVVLSYVGVKVDPKSWSDFIATITGGSIMILGYYVYEFSLLSIGVIPLEDPTLTAAIAALLEVPFNIMQMLVGILVSIPLVRRLRRTLSSSF